MSSIDRRHLPRESLPKGEFQLGDLPDHVPDYSGDLDAVQIDGDGDVPRAVHMALAIAITNVDQYMAFDGMKRDTLDALTQVWRALPESGNVTVEYSRSATSINVERDD